MNKLFLLVAMIRNLLHASDLLQSKANPKRRCIDLCKNLRKRLAEYNYRMTLEDIRLIPQVYSGRRLTILREMRDSV